SPVGLGAGLDLAGVAAPGLARFGFGFLELGPVTLEPFAASRPIERRASGAAIWYPDEPANPGLAALERNLRRAGRLPARIGVRLGQRPGSSPAEAAAERRQLISALAPLADFLVLDHWRAADAPIWPLAAWRGHLAELLDHLRDAPRPVPLLIALPPDGDREQALALAGAALELGAAGVVIDGSLADEGGGRLAGRDALAPTLELIRLLRQEAPGLALIGGGAHQPADALALLEAGADLIQLHSGLVDAGPGLPKRINEAIHAAEAPKPPPAPDAGGLARLALLLRQGWLWHFFLGLGMIIGGALAALIAATRVILPYDEAFLGLGRTELAAINARLLPFMAHDRVTLAGTMLSIGALYAMLAAGGMRRGEAWAGHAIVASAAPGFASFFLFLGFGYFDPLHALAALLLLAFFWLGLRGTTAAEPPQRAPSLTNDRTWRRGLWGQLIFVALGAGLIGAGLLIAAIGVNGVFVAEDLAFLRTDAAPLRATNARLIPLVAHDRAGFGGALAADGIAVLTCALWGFRRGARCLWLALALAGLSGFAAAISVHLAVGYTDWLHLTPAFLGLGLFAAGLVCAYPYLCFRPAAERARGPQAISQRELPG
ncbi:MAG TPA: hypothetical protein VGE07_16775, partial [Herpetosiphonaceae bacterium]